MQPGYLVIFGLLCFGNVLVFGSEIVFDGSAISIKPLLTRDLKLRCSLQDTTASGSIIGRSLEASTNQVSSFDKQRGSAVPRKILTQTTENVDFVTSMVISRDGTDLATITEHIPAKSLGNFSEIQVTGQLTGQPGVRGFLEVSWKHPSVAQAGTYRCDADTVNGQGHSFDFSTNLQITDEEISFNELVDHVHTMELEKDELKKNEMKTNETIDAFNKTLQAMKTENAALKQTVDAMKNQSSAMPKVFFSSMLTWDKVVADGQTVVYDGVLVNEGAAYNKLSGVFTCPMDGFYHFEVNALSENSLNFELELQLNSQYVVSVLSMGAQGYQGSSNSATLKLAKGDIVRVVGAYSRSYLHGNSQQHEALSTFSGRLIALP